MYCQVDTFSRENKFHNFPNNGDDVAHMMTLQKRKAIIHIRFSICTKVSSLYNHAYKLYSDSCNKYKYVVKEEEEKRL